MNFNIQEEVLCQLMSEGMQYQSVIQLLMSKLTSVKQQITNRDILIQEQSKLIQGYQQASEVSRKQSNKISRGVLKATKEAREIDECVFCDYTAQHAAVEQLCIENENLRRIIQINQEFQKTTDIKESMKDEKPNINHLMKAKSAQNQIDYGDSNPFNRNFKMKKFGDSNNSAESHESRIINMALA